MINVLSLLFGITFYLKIFLVKLSYDWRDILPYLFDEMLYLKLNRVKLTGPVLRVGEKGGRIAPPIFLEF